MEPSQVFLDTPERIRAVVEGVFLDDACPPGITALLCDADDRGLMASPCDDAPLHSSLRECRTAAWVFAGGLAESCPGGSMLFVINRPAPASVTDSDRSWHRAIHEACAEHGVRALGVWLVTPGQARELSVEDVAV